MAQKYFGIFGDRQQIIGEFFKSYSWEEPMNVPEDFPTDDEIVFAAYLYEDYSGTAIVVFKRGDQYYVVHGGHCSCYGLEGQWDPEETSYEALCMYKLSSMFGEYESYIEEAWVELFPRPKEGQ